MLTVFHVPPYCWKFLLLIALLHSFRFSESSSLIVHFIHHISPCNDFKLMLIPFLSIVITSFGQPKWQTSLSEFNPIIFPTFAFNSCPLLRFYYFLEVNLVKKKKVWFKYQYVAQNTNILLFQHLQVKFWILQFITSSRDTVTDSSRLTSYLCTIDNNPSLIDICYSRS